MRESLFGAVVGGIAVLGAVLVLGKAALALTQSDAPAVSDVTRLQWENAGLKQQLALATAQRDVCQGQLAPAAYKATSDALDADVKRLLEEFEKANPGWTLAPSGRPVKKGGD